MAFNRQFSRFQETDMLFKGVTSLVEMKLHRYII